jgi:hypothetical protein
MIRALENRRLATGAGARLARRRHVDARHGQGGQNRLSWCHPHDTAGAVDDHAEATDAFGVAVVCLTCTCGRFAFETANSGADAIISLDFAGDVTEQFVRDRLKTAGAHSGQALVSALQLSDRTDEQLGHLRALRNYYGAHPSQARFWDFDEDYAETVGEMFAIVRGIAIVSVALRVSPPRRPTRCRVGLGPASPLPRPTTVSTVVDG